MKPTRPRRPLEQRAPGRAPARDWKVVPLADGSWGLYIAGRLTCYGDAERMAAIAERLRAADAESEGRV